MSGRDRGKGGFPIYVLRFVGSVFGVFSSDSDVNLSDLSLGIPHRLNHSAPMASTYHAFISVCEKGFMPHCI